MDDTEITGLDEWIRRATEREAGPGTGQAAMAGWREQITAIMTAHPELCDFGFGVYDQHAKTRGQIADELARERAAMLEPRSIGQFGAAQRWLGEFKKLSRPNKRGTSYGLKHVAAPSIGYCTNGMFIAAAVAAGFSLKRVGANAYFNISSEAWDPARARHAE
ncbi:MAG: hypothetical protein ABSC06_36085 [Rhodopila sp.]